MSQINPAASIAPSRTDGYGVLKFLSHSCFILGFVSILASLLVWVLLKTPEPGQGERFAIFVGLWAPTFFALSDRLDRYVTSKSR